MQRAVKELYIVHKLQQQAKAKAGRDRTGGASHHGVTVVYYPRCRRFSWFDNSGAISKREAVKQLER